MKVTDFSNFLYNKLPKVYRDEDQNIGYPLKRYLESLVEGGFAHVIEGVNEFITLIDPDKIPEEYLPHLCNSFGLTYFPDLDSTYQRKFLSNVGEIMKRRGTYAGIRYFIKATTGFDSKLEYVKSHGSQEGNFLNVYLLANTLSDFNSIEVSIKAVTNYIGFQVPYFITPIIMKYIESTIIYASNEDYEGCVVTSYRKYQLSVSPTVTTRPIGEFILDTDIIL